MKFYLAAGLLAVTLSASVSSPISAAATSAHAVSIKSKELKGQLPSTVAIPADAKVQDGHSAFDEMLEHARSLNDYTFESGVITHQGGKSIVETGRFYFKKPGQIRVDVEKAGFKSGSTLIRDAKGRIHAVPGKLLRFMSFDLSADSDMLKTANGYNMLEVDFESLLSSTRKAMEKAGCKWKVTTDVNTYGPGNMDVRIIEIANTANRPEHRIVYSTKHKLPVEWTVYKDGAVFSTSMWKELEQNAGLSDDLFRPSKKDEGISRNIDGQLVKPIDELAPRTTRGASPDAPVEAAPAEPSAPLPVVAPEQKSVIQDQVPAPSEPTPVAEPAPLVSPER